MESQLLTLRVMQLGEVEAHSVCRRLDSFRFSKVVQGIVPVHKTLCVMQMSAVWQKMGGGRGAPCALFGTAKRGQWNQCPQMLVQWGLPWRSRQWSGIETG
jgi:hypothetical protein